MNDQVHEESPLMTEAGRLAVSELSEFVRHQDHLFHSWIRFLTIVEAALAAAYAHILNAPSDSDFPKIGLVLIAVMGLVFTRALVNVACRESFWQGRFFHKLYGLDPGHLMHSECWDPHEEPTTVPVFSRENKGHVAGNISFVGWILMWVWAVAGIYAVIFALT